MPTEAPARPKDRPATIDPELENGAVALAEEILPPDPQRTERGLKVQDTFEALKNTLARVDAAIERQQEIAEAIRKQPSETDRKKLNAERQDLTGELLHAPADAEAVARDFAEALRAWAPSVISVAKAEARRLYGLGLEKRNARVRALNTLRQDDAAGHGERMSGPERNKARARAAEITEELAPTESKANRCEDLASRAHGSLTRRFDAGRGGDSLYLESGPARWVDGVRGSVARKTTGLTGASSSLKPRGW